MQRRRHGWDRRVNSLGLRQQVDFAEFFITVTFTFARTLQTAA